MKTSDFLEECATLFESGELKWVRNYMAVDKNGDCIHPTIDVLGDVVGACMAGAVFFNTSRHFAADPRNPTWLDVRLSALAYLNSTLSDDYHAIAGWNDEPCRTPEEVIDVIRLAAKTAWANGD